MVLASRGHGGSALHHGDGKMIETEFMTANSTPHNLVVLTANDLDAVSGGTTTVSFAIPTSWVIYANLAAASGLAGTIAGGGVAGIAAAGWVAADGLLNAWADSKMSNTRKSN
jgi:hypothetical protein